MIWKRINKKPFGFTLIELIAATALMGVTSIFLGMYLNEQVKLAVSNKNIAQANAQINQFFGELGLFIRRQKETFELTRFDPPLIEVGGDELAKSLQFETINIQGSATGTYFNFRVENQCLPYPTRIPSLVDLGLTDPERNELFHCSGCPTNTLPRAMVTEGTITKPVLPGDLSGADGNPFTGVICLRVEGTLEPRKTGVPVKLKSSLPTGYCLNSPSNAVPPAAPPPNLVQEKCNTASTFILTSLSTDTYQIQKTGTNVCVASSISGVLTQATCSSSDPSQSFTLALPNPSSGTVSFLSAFRFQPNATANPLLSNNCFHPTNSNLVGASIGVKPCDSGTTWEVVAPAPQLKASLIALTPIKKGSRTLAKVQKNGLFLPIKKVGPNTIRVLPSLTDWTQRHKRK
ncbi:prepilin-type N-terminal cleavage/methylation domain-containing protein [bacterium]|nr:prepilin-type N-terminal cleavage/methylation domain-containing protein [bacterium]